MLEFSIEFVECHAFYLEVVVLVFVSIILVLITILVMYILKHLL